MSEMKRKARHLALTYQRNSLRSSIRTSVSDAGTVSPSGQLRTPPASTGLSAYAPLQSHRQKASSSDPVSESAYEIQRQSRLRSPKVLHRGRNHFLCQGRIRKANGPERVLKMISRKAAVLNG